MTPLESGVFGNISDRIVTAAFGNAMWIREAHWAGFNRAMAPGATQLAGRATITRALTHSKGTIYVEMSFAVVTDGRSQAIGSVAVALNATQRYQNERALRERLETLEKQNSGSD